MLIPIREEIVAFRSGVISAGDVAIPVNDIMDTRLGVAPDIRLLFVLIAITVLYTFAMFAEVWPVSSPHRIVSVYAPALLAMVVLLMIARYRLILMTSSGMKYSLISVKLGVLDKLRFNIMSAKHGNDIEDFQINIANGDIE